MDIPIQHAAFAGRGLAVRAAGLLKGPRLLIDGGEVRGRRFQFSLRDNSGSDRTIRLRTNWVDPVPRVEIDGQTIQLARPFAWYEYVWIGLPIVLLFAGGALGGLFGGLAMYSSGHVFRSKRRGFAEYGLTGLISLAAVLVFLAVATALRVPLRVRSGG